MAADVVVSIPNHSHKLRGLSRSGYRCDICRVHNAPGRHRCIAGCDYVRRTQAGQKRQCKQSSRAHPPRYPKQSPPQDACASCIAKARAAATTRATAHVVSISAHSHKLQALARSGYRCDLCRTHNAPGRHRCVAGCDYVCWTREPMRRNNHSRAHSLLLSMLNISGCLRLLCVCIPESGSRKRIRCRWCRSRCCSRLCSRSSCCCSWGRCRWRRRRWRS